VIAVIRIFGLHVVIFIIQVLVVLKINLNLKKLYVINRKHVIFLDGFKPGFEVF
jgi:hypothetical protein